MTDQKELRVHGVSGTAPRDMLYTDPVGPDLAPGTPLRYTSVYRKPERDVGVDVSAYHWGGLTAGRWNTAFWILLAPFAFANIAGWMADRQNRMGTVGVRVAGLGLTALFVSQLAVIFIDLPHHWLSSVIDGFWLQLAMFGLFLLFGYLFFVLVEKVSAQSHFETPQKDQLDQVLGIDPSSILPKKPGDAVEEETDEGAQWDDPAGASLADPVVWRRHAILNRLRRLHLAAGMLVVAMTVARGVGQVVLEGIVIGLFGVVVGLVVATTVAPRQTWLRRATSWAPVLSVAAVGGAIVVFWVSDLPATDHWIGVHETTFHVALFMFAGAFLILFSGLAPLGVYAIGAQLGGAMGIAGAVVLEVAVGVNELRSQGVSWTAVAMLGLVLVILFTAALLSRPWDGTGLGIHRDDRDRGRNRRFMTILRRIAVGARRVFQVAAVFAIIAGGLAVYFGCLRRSSCSPFNLGEPSGGLVFVVGTLITLAVLWWVAHRILGPMAVLVPIGAAVVVGAVILGFLRLRPFGLDLDLKTVTGVSIAVTILLPASFFLTSLIRGFRDAERRRKVGILWDVASFFPRWYHPLAPPAYGPFVVQKLKGELEANPRDVLSAHSQGAMIALVTLGQMKQGMPPSFLTYGCQLGEHYPNNFPAVGIAGLVDHVCEKLGEGRWVSLWRSNDPLGGEVKGAVLDLEVDEQVGHSRYELTNLYQTTRNGLL